MLRPPDVSLHTSRNDPPLHATSSRLSLSAHRKTFPPDDAMMPMYAGDHETGNSLSLFWLLVFGVEEGFELYFASQTQRCIASGVSAGVVLKHIFAFGACA